MSEKREIQYREIGRTASHVVIEITKQTHRGDEFAKGGEAFRSMKSCGRPQYLESVERFYVRGGLREKDNYVLIIPIDKLEIFAADVAEYNRTEGGFKKENWRAARGNFYWTTYGGCMENRETERFTTVDNCLYESGNYFRTKEQAAEAARRLKECLKQYHTEIGE